jgi:tetratricopeptide (TPR) repeat protein
MLLGITAVARASLDDPKLVPAPSTESQEALIKEGVALHEKGDYNAAIKKYEQVLAENPSNVGAMYELSYTLEAKKDYQKSLETARKGVQYRSELLDQFYLVIGNDLDDMGQPDKALAAYREGVSVAPRNFLLHYNIALVYERQKKPDEARKAVKTAAILNPKHASSQLLLAVDFSKSNFRIPSLLAAGRFLILEPNTARSGSALDIVQQALRAGVGPGSQPGNISILFDPNSRKEEGDFTSIDMVLSISRAGSSMDKDKKKTEAEIQVDQWSILIGVLTGAQANKKAPEFVLTYYAPYFSELKKRGFVEPFVYHILQKSRIAGVSEWLAAHQAAVKEFLAWSDGYQWPKPKQ